MPNGEIGKEFTDTLALVGKWTKQYGHTIYGTRGGPMKPEKYGVTTQDSKFVYLHLFEKPENGTVFIPGNYDASAVQLLNNESKIKTKVAENGIEINLNVISLNAPDNIIRLSKK